MTNEERVKFPLEPVEYFRNRDSVVEECPQCQENYRRGWDARNAHIEGLERQVSLLTIDARKEDAKNRVLLDLICDILSQASDSPRIVEPTEDFCYPGKIIPYMAGINFSRVIDYLVTCNILAPFDGSGQHGWEMTK